MLEYTGNMYTLRKKILLNMSYNIKSLPIENIFLVIFGAQFELILRDLNCRKRYLRLKHGFFQQVSTRKRKEKIWRGTLPY